VRITASTVTLNIAITSPLDAVGNVKIAIAASSINVPISIQSTAVTLPVSIQSTAVALDVRITASTVTLNISITSPLDTAGNVKISIQSSAVNVPVDIKASSVTVPISIQSSAVTLPISISGVASGVVVPISIQSSAVTVPVSIQSSVATLNVNISAQAITLNVNIQEVTKPTISPSTLLEKGTQIVRSHSAQGPSSRVLYTVPSDKTAYIVYAYVRSITSMPGGSGTSIVAWIDGSYHTLLSCAPDESNSVSAVIAKLRPGESLSCSIDAGQIGICTVVVAEI
ncbi:MAG: hypothetical protein QW579_04690, partial [Desulfurococcaceae archaeon]